MKIRHLFAGLVAGLACTASAQLIVPTSVTGAGLFANSPSLIANGYVPNETSVFFANTNVYWVGPLAVFTLDFGSVFEVRDLLASVDNNDRYHIQYSTNGTSFAQLATIQASYGEVPSFPGGMDTFSTDVTSPEYIAGLDFAPVNARYLRIYASHGDSLYAVGELQAFGVPVPEPSTYGLIGAGALLGLVAWKRRRRTSR